MLRETLPQGPHEADIRGLLPEIPYRKEFVNKNDVIEEQGLDDLRDILCSHERLRPWSDNPRLYALLRMSMPAGDGDITAQPFVVKGELAEGLSDYGLPFTTETLPSILKEQPKIAQRLLDLQAAVKSCSELMSFKDEALSGKHRVASNPPFVSTERLAVTQGAFGQVESVRNTKTKLVFARKSMLRSREGRMSDVEGREDRQWRLEHFRNEVEVLRKLHDGVHMVRFWGSYTHPEYFALLFQPVAERTLHDLLVHPAPISEMDSILLRKSFGCLAFGLSWLHSNMIRHKDIKPANILISNGSVLYCDFGSALDGSLRNTTQTEGIPQKRTPRYVSPETHRGEARSEASDVWSLGCVFLEMLTRLTAYNLDELLQSIHEIADISCSVQDVCYWMGVEDDILQTWITKLAEELGSEEPAGWTANMVKEDASKRPLAADLVCEIQRHWSAHADTSYIGQCCATSPAPSAPESRGPDRPSSPSIRVPSVMSLPTSINRPSIHGNDKVSPEPPSPRDTTQPPEPVSKVTPAKEPSELIYATMSNGRSHQATLVYEAQLSEAQMQFLEGPAESQETISRFATMRLYEFRSENVLHSTRQLMFLPNVQSDLSDPLSIWLPLADTSVEQHEAQLLLTWSDCNHHVTDFANGRTLHSRIYKCREPNNTLLIHFASESEARQFAGKVHSPSETQLLAQSDPIALSPDATEIRWGFTSNGELMQHSTPAEAAHTVQIIEDSASALRTNARGLLVKGQDATVASTSRIYWLPSVIDLVLGTDDSNTSGQSKPSVLVSGLQRPDYKSSVQNVHHSQKDVQGKCHHVELAVCCVSWCFKFIDDRHMFLDGFSEWSLRLCMSIKQLSRVNKMWKDKLYGKADLLFFVHEDSASAAVTFRLKDGEYGSRHWVTGRLPNSSAAERYGDMEASVKLSSYYRKESLHLGSMQATSAAAGSEDPAPEVKDDCLETVKLTFHSIADKIDFQHHVTQYYNFYGGARQEMHKSSVSSGSYTRRATGNSLSLQSTSSSSRRS